MKMPNMPLNGAICTIRGIFNDGHKVLMNVEINNSS